MKKIISAFMLTLALASALGVTAAADEEQYLPDGTGYTIGENSTIILSEPTRLTDMADVLSDDEEEYLLAYLNEVSDRQQMDIVVVTIDSSDGKSLMEYADDFYDYNGFGFGDNNDGLLLLVNIGGDGTYSSGNSWISTCGFGITAFTDEGIQYIGRQITPELLDGDYSAAFEEFVLLCDDFITQADSGTPYDVGSLPKGEFPLVRNLLISLGTGLVIALIATGVMKLQLKSVKSNSLASDYVKKDSLNVTASRDIFLYSHVDATERESDSNSGGSDTHISSSDTTHGGGGF
ncbi:MAG: TPM domain-containing protein [Oscillospiraceae bacterium]